jgi:endo-alpha-1,4-polygalactosaminidase (GH114 family)
MLIAALLLGASTGGAAQGAGRKTKLATARSFALAIGDRTLSGNLHKRYRRFDLVIVDGESARAGNVAAIRSSGTLALAYLDAGTIEPYRSWYARAKRYRLEYWSDWGEWYANVNASGYRKLLERQVAPGMLAKGFDGLFLDNTDMTETHPARKRGMRSLVAGLSRLVHSKGKLLFTQNGPGVNWRLRRYYDGINFEDVTFTFDFDRDEYVRRSGSEVREAQRVLRRFHRAGLKVTVTDYLPAGARRKRLIAARNACAAGALPYVSGIGLSRVPTRPLLCD